MMCKKVIHKRKIRNFQLGTMPITETPFHRLAVDVIGPADPVSKKWNRYILTLTMLYVLQRLSLYRRLRQKELLKHSQM